MTIEELKACTKVTDSQLDTEFEEPDSVSLSAHFDNVESYLVNLGLTLSQQTDIKDLAFGRGTQTAIGRVVQCHLQSTTGDVGVSQKRRSGF